MIHDGMIGSRQLHKDDQKHFSTFAASPHLSVLQSAGTEKTRWNFVLWLPAVMAMCKGDATLKTSTSNSQRRPENERCWKWKIWWRPKNKRALVFVNRIAIPSSCMIDPKCLPAILPFHRLSFGKEKVDDLLLPWHHQNHRYTWESKNGCRELVSLLLPHIYIYLRYLPCNVNTKQYQVHEQWQTPTAIPFWNLHLFGGKKTPQNHRRWGIGHLHGRVFEGLESWQPQATKVASNSYAATYQREPGLPFENFPSSTPLQVQGYQVSASKNVDNGKESEASWHISAEVKVKRLNAAQQQKK